MPEELAPKFADGESSPVDQDYLNDLAAAMRRRSFFDESIKAIDSNESLTHEEAVRQYQKANQEFNEELKALGERAVALDMLAQAEKPLGGYHLVEIRKNHDRGYQLNRLKEICKIWENIDDQQNSPPSPMVRAFKKQIEVLESQLKAEV
jgi:recombinational DNA repair ATPase RecF